MGPSATELEMKRMDQDFQVKIQQMEDERAFKKAQLDTEEKKLSFLGDGLEKTRWQAQ